MAYPFLAKTYGKTNKCDHVKKNENKLFIIIFFIMPSPSYLPQQVAKKEIHHNQNKK